MRYIFRCTILTVIVSLGASVPSQGQTVPNDDPDLALQLAQPDFTLVALPTTLRVPRHKGAFRVTHRFTRELGNGDFGDLASDLFGLDNGAQIGLEYRFGLFSGTQIGFHRTSDRTTEFFAQHEVKAQSESFPFTISAFASIDGTNNFRDSYSPALGAVVSRTIAEHVAFYLEPIWVNNSNILPSALVDNNDAMLLGLGTRLRVRPTVYIVIEGTPRIAGDKPNVTQIGVGLEKRAGGHTFQLNFSNGFGTTLGQVARGGTGRSDWYMGFNISRKFF